MRLVDSATATRSAADAVMTACFMVPRSSSRPPASYSRDRQSLWPARDIRSRASLSPSWRRVTLKLHLTQRSAHDLLLMLANLQLLTVAACTVLLAACGSTAVTSTGPSVISKCGLTLGAPESAIGPSGGSGQVVLTTTPECAWTASADASWVTHIEPSSGQGSGTLRVDVAPNPSRAPRQTTILVNGVRVQIQQAAVPLCVYGVRGPARNRWPAAATRSN